MCVPVCAHVCLWRKGSGHLVNLWNRNWTFKNVFFFLQGCVYSHTLCGEGRSIYERISMRPRVAYIKSETHYTLGLSPLLFLIPLMEVIVIKIWFFSISLCGWCFATYYLCVSALSIDKYFLYPGPWKSQPLSLSDYFRYPLSMICRYYT